MANSKRRKLLLGGLSALGLLGISAWLGKVKILTWMVRQDNDTIPDFSLAPTTTDDICVLTSSRGDGPFYISSPARSDIREDREGKELQLDLTILRYPECTPIEGAVVEIWHCDAHGAYGGYPEGIGHNIYEFLKAVDYGRSDHIEPSNKNTYLRGAQATDASGVVQFTTIIPGWYDPRVPHIHFKVQIGEQEQLISEFCFDQKLCDHLFTSYAPYTKYGKSPYDFKNDKTMVGVLNGEGLLLKPNWQENGPLSVSAKIGVQMG